MQPFQISIPEPCHENWHSMTPTQQGRFCNACSKEVIDFSMMTDTELIGYFSSLNNSNVCGRVIDSQLERVIAFPKEPVKRKFWYWNYITVMFLFFGKTNKISAQTRGEVVVAPLNPQHCPVKTGKVTIPSKPITAIQKTIILAGKIIDEKGSPIPFASVKVKNTIRGTIADADGKFLLQVNAVNLVIEFSALDYLKKEMTTSVSDTGINIVLQQDIKVLNNVVIRSSQYTTTGLIIYKTSGYTLINKKTSITDTIKRFFNGQNANFRIYPNPVLVGNAMKVFAKIKSSGYYFIEITDASGKLVLQQQISAKGKQIDQTVRTDPRWSRGMYFLKLTDNKKEKVFADSFIVQ